MTEVAAESELPDASRRRWRRAAIAALLLGGVFGGGWLARERLADRVISGQLRDLGLPATYRIESIGPRRQVLRDVVVGDPRHPDLTIARVEIALSPRFGLPGIGRVRLERPRLYGRWNGAGISFGSLDRLLFGAKGAEPFRLPDLDLSLVDGRARVTGDHGAIGVAVSGNGGLRDGFQGTVAAIAPDLALSGCALRGLSLYGRIAVRDEQPGITGPLRLRTADCAGAGALRLADAEVQVDGRADRDLAGGGARLELRTGTLGHGEVMTRGLTGTVDASYRRQQLTARYDLVARAPSHPQVSAATLALNGIARSRDGLGRIEAEGSVDVGGLRPGIGLGRTLDGYQRAAADTLVAPLLGQVRAALDREARGSRLRADYVARQGPHGFSLTVPRGLVTGGSGATLLALSRLNFASGPGPTRLAGNFSTGGPGLPQITGRLEQGARGQTRVQMAMAEYRAGRSRLAMPGLTLEQDRSGALRFTGLAAATGALPGGYAQDLVVPLDGARSADGRLALWRGCTRVRFSSLTLANLTLDGQSLGLCPAAGQAMVASDRRGLRIAVGTPRLDLTGRLGDTPVRIVSGPAGFAAPGQVFVTALDVALGPSDTAARLRLTDLRASLGSEVTGTFAGADARLAAVPLDLLDASGRWRYAGGRLTIEDGLFRLEDRAQVDRFAPLKATGATLTLADNRIAAGAVLREPGTSREVAHVGVEHDLGTARGRADLRVDGLLFDSALQPDMLSRQLLGVVANVRGLVKGRGRIDWTPDRVTSTGRFGTDSLDFAAAFGPVKGVAGQVQFSDLLGMVTPPHQRLAIASINPGIEVTGGELLFALRPDSVVAVEGGSWPFLDGRLLLRPAEMRFGVAETRRFVLDIEALDAAKFLAQMELANLAASGTFDGSLPLVFDENGGRIEGGLLTSRPPGGNLSYVGALTYKDLSPIANFAFDALKSLDYRTMTIVMDGALEGEIVTRVQFDGVKQGQGAKRNFLTRRIANLPLQFNVNLRAPFYGLISAFKAMYDPAYIKDPRTLGLLDAQGRPVAPAKRRLVNPIQPPVSENKP